jgi:hypothetical protein
VWTLRRHGSLRAEASTELCASYRRLRWTRARCEPATHGFDQFGQGGSLGLAMDALYPRSLNFHQNRRHACWLQGRYRSG